MRPENKVRLEKIQRLSIILRLFCKLSVIAVTLGILAGVAAIVVNRGGTVRYFDLGFPIDQLTLGGRFLLAGAMALTGAVMVKCFFHLHRLMGNYSRAEIFTAGSARQIRQLGITCILWGGLNFFWAFLPLLIAAHPPSSVNGNLAMVGIGFIVLTISWFMEMAVELNEDNELTI